MASSINNDNKSKKEQSVQQQKQELNESKISFYL